MKLSHLLPLVLATTIVSACADESTGPGSEAPRQMSVTSSSNRYVVKFTEENVPGGFANAVSALGGSVETTYARIGGVVVAGLSAEAAAQLKATAGVEAVEQEYEWSLDPVAVAEAEAAAEGVESIANPAGAFFYARQWHMRQIRADVAWAAGRRGSSNVKVAILDTGLDPSNLDLSGKIDVTNSTSFVPSDNAYINFYFPGKPSWIDLHYHGTHVGATVSSNGVIGAGVTSQVTLMAVKVLSVTGSGSSVGILDGIMWAADHGADVINMSLGSSFFKKDYPGYISLVNRAINYATSKGVTIVVSAGNSSFDLDHDGNGYKTYCSSPNVTCVSATGPTAQASVNGPWTNPDAFASYSNFGRSSIDVAAPGGNVSAVYAACSKYSLQIPVCRTGNYILGLGGTSMASPHVAGLAALLVEDLGRNPGRIASALQNGAVDLGPKGVDAQYGRGRIDVVKTLGL